MNPPEPAATPSATSVVPPTGATYPPAERLDLVDVLHGQEVPDPYRWLEDPEDARTRAWLEGQDVLYADQLAGWDGVEAIGERLRELLGVGVVGVPIWRGDRRFFMRREGQQEHGVLFVEDGRGEQPRVLLDPIALDPSGLTTLDAWQPSLEGDLLAYQVSESGSEESVLRVMDVATGETVDGPIDRARYSPVAWLPGGEAYYYVRRLAPELVPEDERQYHRRVWLHRVGTDPDGDVLVFGDGRDLRNYYGVGVSRDGRWLTVSAAMGTAPRNDVWLADLSVSSPEEPHLDVVVEGLDAQVGLGVGRDGRLYVSTDLDAPRGRVAVADPTAPGRENWRDLLPEDPEAVLEDFAILDGPRLKQDGRRPLLLVGWTRHSVSEITVHDLETGERLPGEAGSVPLPGLGTTGGIVSRIEGGHEAWFTYTDHTTPPHVYRYDGLTGEVSLYASPPGTVAAPDVVTRQVTYASKDGTAVRMFLTARADLLDDEGRPTRPLPTILYGYGGFGVSLDPGYSGSTLTWAEAGGLYAVANLRGGGEEGESWHRAGMLGNKQNVYDDFYAAAEYLLDQGWTTRERLSISGGSNGGLLVGVALTQRPDLFRAVVCSAPLLDMIRYEQFGLGATWNEEYGTVEKAEEFGWLFGYSPYHHVEPGRDYPATLFTIFDSDTRVDPLHARKLAAALQHAVEGVDGAGPILLRREKDVGHGARALSRTITLSAQTLAFAAHWTGLTWSH